MISEPRASDRVSHLIGADIKEYMSAVAPRPTRSRVWKAMMLAPTLEICAALLRGERVPWRMFDPRQAERFGLRRRTHDGRYGLGDFNDVRQR